MSIGIYVVFGVLLAPLYLLLAAWLLGKPRDSKAVGVGVAFIAIFLAALVAGSLFPIASRLLIP